MIRKCRVCKKSFEGDKNQDYCSKECRAEARREYQRRWREGHPTRNCQWKLCGKKFSPKSPDQRYCCPECAKKAQWAWKSQDGSVQEEPKWCTVVFHNDLDLFQEFRPVLGKKYRARYVPGYVAHKPIYIVPGFGKYGLVAREGELEVLGFEDQ